MKRKPSFLLLKIILVAMLLVGLLLTWASLQPFETLSSLLGNFASDGDLELFNVFLYQTLKLPFALIGLVLTLTTTLMLFLWKKTEVWMQEFPVFAKQFFIMLFKDKQNFIQDVKAAFVNQGWKVNVILLVGMLVALIIRLANLNIPLGHDEAYMYNAFASRSLWHMVSNYHLPNNHVLLSIIIKITTSLLGNHVWVLRLPTIVVGVLTVPVAYWFAKRSYSIETALLTALLVAILPILVQYSVLARGYSIIILFTLLTLALGDYVRVKQNRFAWMLIVIFSALGFFTMPIMLFPFGALYIWLFASVFLGDVRSYETNWVFLKYWLGSGFSTALLTIILYTPIMIFNYESFFGNGFIEPLPWEIFPETILSRLINTWEDWTATIHPWIVLLAVFGIILPVLLHKRISSQKVPLQLSFLIWIFMLLVARRPDMLPRFWMFLAVPLLIWATAGIVEPLKMIPIKNWPDWNFSHVLIGMMVVIVFAQGIFTIPSLPARWQQKDDLENVAIYLKTYIQADDLVTASTANLPPLRYFFNYHEIPRGKIRQSGSFQRAFIVVDSSQGETLQSVAPTIGSDIPIIKMDTVQVIFQSGSVTVYECYPLE